MVALVLAKRELLNVPFVASTPMTLVLLSSAAGLIAGSIPINGIGKSFLSISIALVVAVLHATMMSLHPLFIKF